MTAHNELAAALREQRAHLVQRELLLDTVMQNSPVALVLVDANDRIAYANIAARPLVERGTQSSRFEIQGRVEPGPGRFARARRDFERQPVFHGDRRSRRDISPVAAFVYPAGTHVFGCIC